MKHIFLILISIYSFLHAGDGPAVPAHAQQLATQKQLTTEQLKEATDRLHYIISDDRFMTGCDMQKAQDLLREDPLFKKMGIPSEKAIYSVLAYQYQGLGTSIKMGLFEYAQKKPAQRLAAANGWFAIATDYKSRALLVANGEYDQLATFIQTQKQLAIEPRFGMQHTVNMVDPITYKEKAACEEGEAQKQRLSFCNWLCRRQNK